MYDIAEEKINEGLSPFARWLLGAVTTVFGAAMLVIAPSSDAPAIVRAFGVFCILIALACATRGRVRKFIGSSIGVSLFVVALAYLYSQATGGPLFSGRSDTSLLNSLLFMFAFGVPGLNYAVKAKFGYRSPR